MRKSCLLLEEKPIDVFKRFNVSTLEEAFLSLSRTQEINDNLANNSLINKEINSNNKSIEVFAKPEETLVKTNCEDIQILNCKRNNRTKYLEIKRMEALFIKNFIFLKRNIP
jgi:hypothetical protein